jgi:hypothetical protein
MRGGGTARYSLPAQSQRLEIEIAQLCDLDLDIGGAAETSFGPRSARHLIA